MTKSNAAPEIAVVAATRRASDVKFFRVREFERFQHYRNRNPPWVKLYVTMLDDYEFQQLDDATKFHALALTSLASRLDNKIPNDPDWVGARIGARSPIDFDALLEAGFLEPIRPRASDPPEASPEQMEFGEAAPPAATGDVTRAAPAGSADASTLLARRYQDASAETETEGETETHTETDTAPASAGGRTCVCCGEVVFSKYPMPACLDFARHLKATGRLVGGRAVENPGGLARSFHRKGEADIEIEEFLRPRPPRREFADEPCKVCFGSKYENVPGKGARRCTACLDEDGRPTGKRPKE